MRVFSVYTLNSQLRPVLYTEKGLTDLQSRIG